MIEYDCEREDEHASDSYSDGQDSHSPSEIAFYEEMYPEAEYPGHD